MRETHSACQRFLDCCVFVLFCFLYMFSDFLFNFFSNPLVVSIILFSLYICFEVFEVFLVVDFWYYDIVFRKDPWLKKRKYPLYNFSFLKFTKTMYYHIKAILAWSDITNYHRHSSLNIYYSEFWSLKSSKSILQLIQCLLRTLFLVCINMHLVVSLYDWQWECATFLF